MESTSEEGTKAPEPRKWAVTRQLVLVTLVTSFGSSLQYGYNLWVVNHPATLIQDFYNSTLRKKKISTEASFLSLLYSLTSATFSLGGLMGSLLVCPMVDRCGRKGALILNNIFSIFSSVILGCSAMVHAYEYTIFSRLLIGISSGIFSCAVPLYLGEVAPRNLRGSVITVSLVFITTGILISQILSLQKFLGTAKDWPILLSLPGFLAFCQVIVLPTFPESPRYLLIQKKDEEKARQALKKLRCQDDVESEVEELCQEDISESVEKDMTGLKLLCYRGLRWQVISVAILMGGQQLTGINAVMYYADKIYITMHLKKQEARYFNVFSTVFFIVTLMVMAYTVDSVGRRILILTGFGICSIACILLAMTIELQPGMPWMSYVTTAFFFLFLFGHTLGPASIPYVLMLELFLQSSRSTAFAIGGFVQWLLQFLVRLFFLQIEIRIGSYAFLLFWPICIAVFIYIFKIVPETKNKTFVDIKRLMDANTAKKIQVQGANPKHSKTRRLSTHHSIKTKRRSTMPS
ncbi:solute carrier family 2, facilitated glucose transporter member 5-like [Rhineura floridana]|uniref:solute carrier family 2, facilitated glucose transporter member 5-like n=1 Tax=Rhineura floridana TaxID=261503 RepID=UPI002AC871D7|nr:solute carrier family 2, facilitated glucose transporter member 5-like [Rhineura floridana]